MFYEASLRWLLSRHVPKVIISASDPQPPHLPHPTPELSTPAEDAKFACGTSMSTHTIARSFRARYKPHPAPPLSTTLLTRSRCRLGRNRRNRRHHNPRTEQCMIADMIRLRRRLLHPAIPLSLMDVRAGRAVSALQQALSSAAFNQRFSSGPKARWAHRQPEGRLKNLHSFRLWSSPTH